MNFYAAEKSLPATFSKVPFLKEWATEDVPVDADRSPAMIKEAQQRCGEILWTTQRTRPDASYAAMMMARLTTRWPERAIQIAKKILSYYNATRDAGLIVEGGHPAQLVMFSDASHSPAGAKSISGTLVMWRGLPICWRAANQGLTALSSAEAELIALSEGAQLVRSVKTTLADMGIAPEITELRVDATAAIAVASSGGSWRTRHLRLRENWLVELAWQFFRGHASAEIKKFETAGDEVKYEASATTAQLSAAATAQLSTAATTQPSTLPTVNQPVNEGILSRCTQVLVGLGLLAGVTGEEVGDHQAYTGVSSEHELWIAELLVMLTTILLWEWSKRAAGGVKKAVKMKMFKVPPKTGLAKGEGKELLALVGIDERSVEQEARLTALIAKYQDNDKGTLRESEAPQVLDRGRLYHPRAIPGDSYYEKSIAEMSLRLQLQGYKIKELDYVVRKRQQKALFVRPEEMAGCPLWLVFGGNAMVSADWLPFCEAAVSMKATSAMPCFLLIDYPGFGFNSGEPSPAAALESSRQALAQLLAELGQKSPESINLLGHSLGAAAASQLAASLSRSDEYAKVQPGRLLLSSPFLSVDEMAAVLFGGLLPRWLLRALVTHRWNNAATVPDAATAGWQVSIVHPPDDEIVPFKHGEELQSSVRALGRECELLQPKGCSHNDVLFAAMPAYVKLMGLSRL
eukprot:s5143_g7.t1